MPEQAATDRRSDHRRAERDRRTTFRFLMEKPNRRSGRDRRANQNIWSEQLFLRTSN